MQVRGVFVDFEIGTPLGIEDTADFCLCLLGTSQNLTSGWFCRDRQDVNKPFTQFGQALKLGLQYTHGVPGQLDAGFVDGRDPLDNGMHTLPGHGSGKALDRFDGIEQAAIPVVLQHAPAALNGVVFAVEYGG